MATWTIDTSAGQRIKAAGITEIKDKIDSIDNSLDSINISLDSININLLQTLAMPTSGWSLVGEFYEVTVTITGPYTTSNQARLIPILDTITKYDAYQDMELVRIIRVSDTSIKIYAIAANATAFNFELHIIKDNGGVT